MKIKKRSFTEIKYLIVSMQYGQLVIEFTYSP